MASSTLSLTTSRRIADTAKALRTSLDKAAGSKTAMLAALIAGMVYAWLR